MAITKADIAALKKADSLVFRTKNGVSRIECIVRISDTNPFEQRRDVFCTSTSAKEACHVETLARSCAELQTIFSLLKEGDEIEFYWYQGAWDTELLKTHGLCGDALYLQWHRGKKEFKFLVHVSIAKQFAAFRMIER